MSWEENETKRVTGPESVPNHLTGQNSLQEKKNSLLYGLTSLWSGHIVQDNKYWFPLYTGLENIKLYPFFQFKYTVHKAELRWVEHSNTDDSFTTAVLHSFLSLLKKIS